MKQTIEGNLMFVNVRFNPTDEKTYTYHVWGDAPKVGDKGTVLTIDGVKEVEVVDVDVPRPPFATKPFEVLRTGHNNPPDPIEDAVAPWQDAISEAEHWLDGEPVTSEDQMKAVDALTKDIKAALKAVKRGEESEAKPVYDQWKVIKARWKPTIDDLTRIRDGLVALVADYKKALAAKKREEERKAWEAAEKARLEAEEKARQAAAADIEAQREAAAAKQAAIEAEKKAQAAKAERPKGMRKVRRYEIEDYRAVLRWIAKNDRDAMTAFIEEYVRRNFKDREIAGVKTWIDEEAF